MSNLSPQKNPSEYSQILGQLLTRPTNPKFGLSRMKALLEAIGFRRERIRIIQVVGTNGKGSTCAFVEAILRKHGISTGMFSSPHLCTAKERIRINGVVVSDQQFIKAARHVLACAESIADEPSFFECTLAMALWLFQQENITVAVLEAGLGGRLDATTATLPDILGIAQVDLDHQHILGDDVFSIAIEKCHAARAQQPVFISEQSPQAMAGINESKNLIGFRLIQSQFYDGKLGLQGSYQRHNAGLAIELVKGLGLKLNYSTTAQALATTSWPGRMEKIDAGAPFILDGAHNPSAIKLLCDNLRQPQRTFVAIFGSMAGVNCEAKIALLLSGGLDLAHIYLYRSKNPRSESVATMKKFFIKQGFSLEKLSEYKNLAEAVKLACRHQATVLVCGSLYVVGELRGELLGIEQDEVVPNF